MKTRFSIFGTLLLLVQCIPAIGQVTPEKKLIATLGPGETIASGENCFLLDKNPDVISFVTVTGSGSSKEYYCYGNDGKKTGPVKKPDESYWAGCNDNVIDNCIPNENPKTGEVEKYVDFGTGTVSFQGKKFGPYGQVLMFYLSQDEQSFYAVALSAEMKIFFFDKTGRKVELINLPEEIIISPDGSKALAKINGSINPFDPEAMQKMMDNPEEMNNPKINLFGIDGKKYGPYTPDEFSDAWYAPSGQLVVYSNHEVSLDGKVLFRSDDNISPCDIWLSKSGTVYAWADYENIHFSDGLKFVAPLAIKYIDGQLKWISLEEGKHVVLYKKVF
jgi:hypothetical protein